MTEPRAHLSSLVAAKTGPGRRLVLRLAASLAAPFFVIALACAAHAEEGSVWMPEYTEFFGEIEAEGTVFFEEPQFAGQERDDVSLAGKFTFLAEWLDGDLALRFTPFGRLDLADDRRTAGDIREAKIDYNFGPWTLRAGLDTVFWGKTEAFHLIDIVNQTDLAEDIDDEDRLGQPMIRLGRLTSFGEFSAFYFPMSRIRRFPGEEGRLRFALPVNVDNPIFEPSAGRLTPSFALRYSGFVGPVDLGLHVFHGLGRDPSFRPDDEFDELLTVYQRITQGGIDFQFTSDATLWKFEALLRGGEKNADFQDQFFGAFTGGVEHTLFGIFESNADLGLIAEYAFDSRGQDALTAFQNDVILGARLALNDVSDTEVLVTAAADTQDGGISFRLEAERRFGSRFSAGLEGVGFVNQDKESFAGALADDSFLRLKLKFFF
ncbi:MAG: hypothetical protein AAF416_09590 [Pseudomonadota bacterium]